jgi:glutaredoxin|tara:strand:+ start:1971 stop:2204 length:234 start_codon:yes stop_codon:yes gene_type:complete
MIIKMYSALWCPACVSARKFLDEKEINYEYIDITNNTEAIDFIKKVNNGKRIIPTFVINNQIYANPGISKLNNLLQQ